MLPKYITAITLKNSKGYYATDIKNGKPVFTKNITFTGSYDDDLYAKILELRKDKNGKVKTCYIQASRQLRLGEERIAMPILRCTEHTEFPELGLTFEPWEHCIFIDKYMIKYIWDTRKVTGITELTTDMLSIVKAMTPARDNNAKLDCTKEQSKFIANLLATTSTSAFATELYKLIYYRKENVMAAKGSVAA